MSFGVGPGVFGSAVFSSVLSSIASPYRGLEVYIAGIDRAAWIDFPSLEIIDELNGRNEASFTFRVQGFGNFFHLKLGERVIIMIGGELVFAGSVEDVREYVADNTDLLEMAVECVDFNQLCDRHVVAAKLVTPGQTLFSIVASIVDTLSGDAGERLKDDGVTYDSTSVQTGPEITKVVFNYQDVAECFDDLAELTGNWWNIDYNLKLHFVDRLTYRAPFDIDEATFREFRKVRVSRGREKYRNVQYLRGGDDITDPRMDTVKGDGEESTFHTQLKLASAPTIVKQPGSVAQTVGIREKDFGKDWYYQIDSDSITQERNATRLTSSETLQITYQGYFPIQTQGRDDTQIAARKAIQGDTGITVHVETDQKIDDADLAEEKVGALLRKFGKIANKVEVETVRRGARSGQLIKVNLPEHELVGDFLVDAVRLSFLGYEANDVPVYNYRVSCLDGEFLGGWAEFFKKNATRGRPFVLRENEKILLLRKIIDILGLTDTVSTSEALGAYTLDKASRMNVGARWVGGYRRISPSNAGNGLAYGPMVGAPTHVGVS